MKTTISALMMGLIVSHFTFAEPGAGDSPAAMGALVQPIDETVLAAPDATGLYVHPEIAADVADGVKHVDSAIRQTPGVFGAMAKSIDKHGLAALAYEDPAVTEKTDSLAQSLGRGIGSFARALAKDMIRTAQGR